MGPTSDGRSTSDLTWPQWIEKLDSIRHLEDDSGRSRCRGRGIAGPRGGGHRLGSHVSRGREGIPRLRHRPGLNGTIYFEWHGVDSSHRRSEVATPEPRGYLPHQEGGRSWPNYRHSPDILIPRVGGRSDDERRNANDSPPTTSGWSVSALVGIRDREGSYRSRLRRSRPSERITRTVSASIADRASPKPADAFGWPSRMSKLRPFWMQSPSFRSGLMARTRP